MTAGWLLVKPNQPEWNRLEPKLIVEKMDWIKIPWIMGGSPLQEFQRFDAEPVEAQGPYASWAMSRFRGDVEPESSPGNFIEVRTGPNRFEPNRLKWNRLEPKLIVGKRDWIKEVQGSWEVRLYKRFRGSMPNRWRPRAPMQHGRFLGNVEVQMRCRTGKFPWQLH